MNVKPINKKQMEKLIEVAKQILAINPDCLLSGSLALKLQGIMTRREPKDIDIYLPYKKIFNKIEGMRNYDNKGAGYPLDNWDRNSFMLGEIQIDVFTPENSYVPILNEGDKVKGISVIDSADIIKFKVSHALGTHWTKYKHRDDIIHILINN